MRLWVDRIAPFAEVRDRDRRRNLVLSDIDAAGFQKWVVFVAGLGFFSDAYLLFASNFFLPMLAFVYWDTDSRSDHETAINSATLAGSIAGQIICGLLADRFGRRKIYGVELVVLIGSVLGAAMSSTGKDNSMSIVSWMIFWRFVTGLSIGAEYPLSAVLTSEFAPTKHRARMLATVFLMQPMGQLAATLVSMAAVAIARHHHHGSDEVAIDVAWRWVIGIGALWATIALLFRLTIPESPRYTLDVRNNVPQANHDRRYFHDAPRGVEETTLHRRNVSVSQAPSPSGSAMSPDGIHAHDEQLGRVSGASVLHPPVAHVRTSETSNSIHQEPSSSHAGIRRRLPWMYDLLRYLGPEGNWRSLAGTAGSWFVLDFAFYGLGMNNPQTIGKIWNGPSSQDNGTSGAQKSSIPIWYTDANPDDSPYDVFLNNGSHALVVVSIGAIIGGLALIYAIDHVNRRKLQAWGFLALALLFIIVGATFAKTVSTNFRGVTVTLYILCQIVFNLGPNGLTFIIPAEIFPTRFRCTCHGVSAAAGKLGSVLAQIFLAKVTFNHTSNSDMNPKSNWLGYVLLVFAAFMVAGAFLTYLIPNVQDENGRSLSLEELAKGRSRTQKVEGR